MICKCIDNNKKELEDALGAALSAFEVDEESGEIRGKFLFAADFPAFVGHFPGQPVLPAVVQVAAARILAARGLGKNVTPLALQRAKFKKMIKPGETVSVTIKPVPQSEHPEQIRLSFTLTGEEGVAATGELQCGITEKTTDQAVTK